MYRRTFPAPTSRLDPIAGTAIGVVVSVGLFVFMALAQSMGRVDRERLEIEESVIVFEVPEIEEVEQEEVVAREDEPAPELESQKAPQFTLDQLDVALNVGVGAEPGQLVGDFVLPRLGGAASAPEALDATDFVAFADLDRPPRPLPGSQLNFPRRLRSRAASGEVVLRLRLSEGGEVLGAEIERSSLPEFEAFVLRTVEHWGFTPPTVNGKPVRAVAILPIPIHIR